METDDDVSGLFSPGYASQDTQLASSWGGLPNSGLQHIVRGNHSDANFTGHLLDEPDFKRRRGEWGGEWSLGGTESTESPMELA